MFQFSVQGFSIGRPTPDRSKKSFFIFETFFGRNRSGFVANRFHKLRHVSVVLNQRSDPRFGFGHRSGLEDFLAQPQPQSLGGFNGSAGQQHFECSVATDETDLHKNKLCFFIFKSQFGNKYYFFSIYKFKCGRNNTKCTRKSGLRIFFLIFKSQFGNKYYSSSLSIAGTTLLKGTKKYGCLTHFYSID